MQMSRRRRAPPLRDEASSVVSGSAYALKPDQKINLEYHRRREKARLRRVKSSFAVNEPKVFPHLNQNGAPRKTGSYKAAARQLAVDRENRRLHANLQNIYSEDAPAPMQKQMMLDTQTRIASGFEEEKVSQYEMGRVRKWDARRTQIERENARIYRRLQTVRPSMDRSSWNRHAMSHEERVRRRSKLPFVLHADSEWDEIEEEEGLRTLERSHLLIEDGETTPRDAADRGGRRNGGRRRRGNGGRRKQYGGGGDGGSRARSTELVELSRSGTGITAVDEEREWLDQHRRRGGDGSQSVPPGQGGHYRGEGRGGREELDYEYDDDADDPQPEELDDYPSPQAEEDPEDELEDVDD